MPTYNLSVDLSQLAQALQLAEIEIANRAAQVVSTMARCIAETWEFDVKNAKGVWIKEKNEYMGSIKINQISPMEIEIYSDYKHAAEIETGRPARDLKRMLDTSTKVRISAKGAKYLIIPFRHNTPGSDALAASMPKNIFNKAKRLTASSHTSYADPRMNWKVLTGQAPRLTQWGGRLGAGLAPKIKKEHKSDPYAGMVRMSGERVIGRKQSSQYLTFRVMTSSSSGWIVPAKPGLFIVKNIVDRYQPLFETAMGEALKGALPTN